MDAHVTEALLFRYFAGQASVLQKQWIDEWVQEPANRELFYAVLESWENQHPQYVADTNAASKRHQRRLEGQLDDGLSVDKTPPGHRFFARRNGWLSLIAAATILLVAGWLGRDRVLYRTYTTGYGQISHLVLTDGSQVTLNANSSLKEPRFDFNDKTRTVHLTGEADFSVTHTADNRRFVVHTDRGLDVVVLGTEFTVYSRQRGDRVVLRKGQVRLLYPQGQATRSVVMKPGDLVSVDPVGRVQARAVRQPERYALWRNNRFVFDRTSLRDVGQLFRETYGLQFVITDPQLAQWTVSGSFTAESAGELLETLAQASGLTYTQRDNTVIITLSQNE